MIFLEECEDGGNPAEKITYFRVFLLPCIAFAAITTPSLFPSFSASFKYLFLTENFHCQIQNTIV